MSAQWDWVRFSVPAPREDGSLGTEEFIASRRALPELLSLLRDAQGSNLERHYTEAPYVPGVPDRATLERILRDNMARDAAVRCVSILSVGPLQLDELSPTLGYARMEWTAKPYLTWTEA